MKVVCPNCQIKCTVADEKVPPTGAWGKCPKCGERFFINPNAINALLDGRQVDRHFTRGVSGRDQAAQKLLEKMRMKQGVETTQADYDESKLIILSIYTPPNYRHYIAGVIVLLLIISIWLLYLFSLTKNTAISATLPQVGPLVSTAYNQDKLREDLITLRKRTVALNRLSQRIDTPGLEIRIFQHLIASLSSGICSNIKELELKSDNPGKSISMQASCAGYSSEMLSPVILIIWDGRRAVAEISGNRESMEIVLYPSIE